MPPFFPFNVYPTGGTAPVAVAGGDWNKDTNVDLLAAHAGTQDAVVLQGNGLGGFTPAGSIPLGVVPTSIALTDVDLDTNLDIVVGHAGGIRIIYGGPTPRPSVTLPAGGEVAALAATAEPLVAVTTTTGTLTVFRTDGVGGLAPSVNSLAVNGGFKTLLLEDLNRDGRADIVVERAADLAFLAGQVAGAFAAPVSIALPGGFAPHGISAQDSDGDLWPDLTVSSTTGGIHLLRGGASGFSGAATDFLPVPTASIATARSNTTNAFLVLQPQLSQATVARFALPPAVNISLLTAPTGLQVTANGQTVVAPNTSLRTPRTPLSLDAPSPQAGAPGTRFVFANWSQGGPKSQTVTVPFFSTGYTASFDMQHQVTTSVTPAGGGTISLSPASPDGFYNAGSTVTASTVPAACYTGGVLTPGANLTVNGPLSVAANFTPSVATNVNSQITINRGSVQFVSSTGQYRQVVRVRNNGATLANVKLVLDNLAAGWTMVGPAGLTQCAAPTGRPYATVAATLASGQRVDVTVFYTRVGTTALNYSTRVLAGAGQP